MTYFCLFRTYDFRTKGFGFSVMVFNCHFQQYFRYIMAVSFIGEGTRNTLRKSPTCRKSLVNIMLYPVHPSWVGFEITTLVVLGTDCLGSYKSKCHTFTTATTERKKESTERERERERESEERDIILLCPKQ